jgi:hypothetical protein
MPLIITPQQKDDILKHPQTKKRITRVKKILVWETYEDNDEVYIWHPFLAETIAVKQSSSYLPGMDFSGIVSVPNNIYDSGKIIWSTDRNYDLNILNINNFNGILSDIYEEECNPEDGDTFINHYTHFCHSIGFAISENLIKELRVVNQYYYYESPIYILRNDKVKNILNYGDNSLINYSLFVTDNDGNFTGEIENLKMFEVKEFT